MASAEIRLDGVSKSFPDREVLREFHLDVMPGEFVTVIGGSGSGKTTLLKMMNGLIPPDSGSVLIRGTNVAETDQVRLRRSIGYVIQGVGLFPHMRVRDNIGYVLNLEKTPPAEVRRRVAELAALVQLDEDLLSRYPRELSGGQRQRVGLARALAAKPGIILMDEPFGAVDDITRKALQAAMKEIHTTLGITVVFITHDIAEALLLGTKVLVLNMGEAEQYGPPGELIANPATPYVAELVGPASRVGHC